MRDAGLLRCGKSCRLRWVNYLRPDIKRGNITSEEEDLIIRLHSLLGNRWSLIAGRLPGRTDNEVKNYWNSHLCKKLRKEGFVFNQTTSKRPKRSQAHNGRCRKMGSEETQPQTPYMQIYSPKPTRIVPWLGAAI
ncbi:hypothetical protein HPP92_015097 [Vanilla planifolia]|uniref:Uncharacterized protein n=1 Tax=Vanilla planifolia TaxID=51239 RepID=A0A835QH77_VANPL|nr:hypothetical protein HPP92_015097 [Vanilla planifolia]